MHSSRRFAIGAVLALVVPLRAEFLPQDLFDRYGDTYPEVQALLSMPYKSDLVPYSDDWLRSMRCSRENASALVEAGWGNPPWKENIDRAFVAVWEVPNKIDTLGGSTRLTCRADQGADAVFDLMRQGFDDVPDSHRRILLEVVIMENTISQSACPLGAAVAMLLRFADPAPVHALLGDVASVRPMPDYVIANMMQESLKIVEELPSDIVMMTGWVPALVAALNNASSRCRLDMSETRSRSISTDHMCEHTFLVCNAWNQITSEAKYKFKMTVIAEKSLAENRGQTRRCFISKGDDDLLVVGAGGGPHEPVAYHLCTCDGPGGLLPSFELWERRRGDTQGIEQFGRRFQYFAHVEAASLRWSEGKPPCNTLEYNDVLALEILLFIRAEADGVVELKGPHDRARWKDDGMSDRNNMTGGKYAHSHCRHAQEILFGQPVSCIWNSGAVRDAMIHPTGHWGSTIHCGVPPEEEEAFAALADLGDDDDACKKGAVSVLLRIGSVVSAPLRLCAERPFPRRRLVACSQPLYGAEKMDDVQPFLVQDWINHHLNLGIEHFQIYDIDGSFQDVLSNHLDKGIVTYLPRFSQRYGTAIDNVTIQINPYSISPHVQDHCAWSWRGKADWVVFVDSPDIFLWSTTLSPGGKIIDLLGLQLEKDQVGVNAVHDLQKDRSNVAGALIQQLNFGGPPAEDARSVLERFVYRERAVSYIANEYPLVHPWNAGLMNVVNFTGRDEAHAIYRFDVATLRADHYVDIFRPRCRTCMLRDDSKHMMTMSVLAQRK